MYIGKNQNEYSLSWWSRVKLCVKKMHCCDLSTFVLIDFLIFTIFCFIYQRCCYRPSNQLLSWSIHVRTNTTHKSFTCMTYGYTRLNRAICWNVQFSTTVSFQNQHYPQEIYTRCYRKLHLILFPPCKLSNSTDCIYFWKCFFHFINALVELWKVTIHNDFAHVLRI